MAMVLLRRSPFSEAHVARIALERAGLPVELRGVMRSGLLGAEGPDDSATELWVDEQHLARARQVLDEPSRPTPAEDDVTCARCGEKNPVNFEVCWHCQSNPRNGAAVERLPPVPDGSRTPDSPARLPMVTALLVVAVIALSVALYRSLSVPRYLEGPGISVEQDEEGCVVEWLRGTRRARWCDRNQDGTNERTEVFDRAGRLTQRSTDANEDGVLERIEVFDTEARVFSRYIDANADGLTERLEELNTAGRVRRVFEDRDGDGRFEQLEELVAGPARYVYREVSDDVRRLEVHSTDGLVHTFVQTPDGWR